MEHAGKYTIHGCYELRLLKIPDLHWMPRCRWHKANGGGIEDLQVKLHYLRQLQWQVGIHIFKSTKPLFHSYGFKYHRISALNKPVTPLTQLNCCWWLTNPPTPCVSFSRVTLDRCGPSGYASGPGWLRDHVGNHPSVWHSSKWLGFHLEKWWLLQNLGHLGWRLTFEGGC